MPLRMVWDGKSTSVETGTRDPPPASFASARRRLVLRAALRLRASSRFRSRLRKFIFPADPNRRVRVAKGGRRGGSLRPAKERRCRRQRLP